MQGQVTSMAEIYRDCEKVDPFVFDHFHMIDHATMLGVERLHTPTAHTMSSSTTSYRVAAAVGDRVSQVGVGVAVAHDVSIAIRSALKRAKAAVAPVRKGYYFGRAGTPHTVAFKTTGRKGGTTVRLQPAPRGTGIDGVNRMAATILHLAGVEDVHYRVEGPRDSKVNLFEAIFDALKQQYGRALPCDWAGPSAGRAPVAATRADDDAEKGDEEKEAQAKGEDEGEAEGEESEGDAEEESSWVEVHYPKKRGRRKTKPKPPPTTDAGTEVAVAVAEPNNNDAAPVLAE